MTPEERARKIFDYIELQFDEDPTYDTIEAGTAFALAQIREAEKEAEFAVLKSHVCHQMDAGVVAKRIYAEGRSSMREEVLKLMKDESVMTWQGGSFGDFELDPTKLENRIRAIVLEEKPKENL